MKPLKTLVGCMAVYSLFAATFVSCSSDPNPVDYINLEKETAYVSLDLSVAATRAEDSNATENETKLSTVSVYIFNDKDILESTHLNLAVTDNKIDKIKTTAGLKTIYAIAAKPIPSIAVEGVTLAQFESIKLSLSIEDLTNNKTGFMMVGCSEKKKVMMSSDEATMPTSNSFAITLTRLAAKTQVVAGSEINTSGIGFSATGFQFAARQTANDFILTPKADIQELKDENSDGTYDAYAFIPTSENSGYITSPTSFQADKCSYLTENIVTNPVSGNTTFVSVKISMRPEKRYSFASGSAKPTVDESKNNQGDVSYHVVGIIDKENGFADYTVGEDNKVMCFHDKEDADRYRDALNRGTLSAMTVSDTDEAMKAPRATRAGNTYETVTFTSCAAYYRVNIASTEANNKTYRIDRNTFYKITINSVKNLGFPTEDYLRPTNPTTPLDQKPEYWMDASFEVMPWNSVDQSVDL